MVVVLGSLLDHCSFCPQTKADKKVLKRSNKKIYMPNRRNKADVVPKSNLAL
jgi:hypothetical protein